VVISRIGRKSKKKQAPAGEPPVLTPAAGFVSGKTSEGRPSLYESLRGRDYLIDRTTADLIQLVLEVPGIKAVLLEGPPGVGKTALTEKIAQWLGADYIYVLATPNTDEDALLYKFVPDENTKSGIRIAEGPLVQAVKKAAAGKKVVLVIDEFDKTRPSTDALLLDLLQNGRVALYLGGKEDVLVADPNNLYIFLTSNNMREFSEPLMRRLVRVDFKYLDPSDVAELLRRRFDGQTTDILAEIYRDTVEAGLRKPATLQELIQLGHALKKMPNAPLDRLLRMFVVKYDDDWEKFKEYLEQKMRQAAERQKKQFLQTVEQQQQAPQQPPTQQEVSPPVSYEEQVLHSVSSEPYVASPTVLNVMGPGGAQSGETYTFKAYISEDMYTAIAKMYPPGDTPEELGKFRVMEFENDRVIVSKEPLYLDEFFELYKNTSTGFDAYIEDKVLLVLPNDLKSLVEHADIVRSYSKRAVHLASKGGDEVEEEVLIELSEPYSPSDPAKLVEATIKARVSVYSTDSETGRRKWEPPLLDKLWRIIGDFCNRRLNYRAGIGGVAADMAGICIESNTPTNLVIEGRDLDDNIVGEIEKRLAERLQPLGLSIAKKCEGGRYERIYIEKSQRWPEVKIECYQ